MSTVRAFSNAGLPRVGVTEHFRAVAEELDVDAIVSAEEVRAVSDQLRDDLVVALLRDAQRRRQLLPRLEQGRVPLQQRLLEPQDLNGASAS